MRDEPKYVFNRQGPCTEKGTSYFAKCLKIWEPCQVPFRGAGRAGALLASPLPPLASPLIAADRTRPISLELLLGVEKRIAMFLGPKILQHHKRRPCTQSHRQDEQMIE